jgi:hypothetical protein
MKKTRIELPDLHDLSGSYVSALAAVDHAINDIEAALSARRFPVRRDGFVEMKMRRDMPYVIHDTAEPNTQILVNRQYKPVGSNLEDGSKPVRYEDYPQVHVHLTPSEIAAVVCPGHVRGLFGDGSYPWSGRRQATAYLERLQRLYELLKAAT